ncbi:MAG: hypothetical protein HN348_00735 [Proteobacteria bacterium]|nr:hypothetical protein [Pseudomonadota bacterium]
MQDLQFRLFGFSIRVLPGFWLLCGVYLLFGLQNQEPIWAIVSFVAVVFASIVLHELGHAVTARRLGLRVGWIRLHTYGGDVTHDPGRPWQNLAVSLGGPGAGLLFGALVFGIAWLLPYNLYVDRVVHQLLWVNVVWSLFNLLPMCPLDGGNALGHGLSVFNVKSAWPIAWAVSAVCGLVIAGAGFHIGWFFVGLIGAYVVFNNVQRLHIWRQQRGRLF